MVSHFRSDTEFRALHPPALSGSCRQLLKNEADTGIALFASLKVRGSKRHSLVPRVQHTGYDGLGTPLNAVQSGFS